jgi:large subunit ribosomal protein L24
MKIKKGDKVVVITGKYKGKSGTVIKAIPKEDRVVVDGVQIAKVHERGRNGKSKGTIVEKPMPIHVSNVKKAEAKAKAKKATKANK